MNDTKVTPDVVATQPDNIKVILSDLYTQINSLLGVVSTLGRLNDQGTFKHISKPTRNELIEDMLDSADTVRETAKVAFHSLKKVKRTRIPDMDIDNLLGVPVSYVVEETKHETV